MADRPLALRHISERSLLPLMAIPHSSAAEWKQHVSCDVGLWPCSRDLRSAATVNLGLFLLKFCSKTVHKNAPEYIISLCKNYKSSGDGHSFSLSGPLPTGKEETLSTDISPLAARYVYPPISKRGCAIRV